MMDKTNIKKKAKVWRQEVYPSKRSKSLTGAEGFSGHVRLSDRL